jgi:nucleotide-binding universal stress UspA family protein
MGTAEVLVVGVDDSSDSRLALEYAVSEAVLHDAVLRVVSAFDSAGMFGARYGVPIPVSDQQIAEKVEAETVALINDVIGTRPDPPKVQVVVQAGAIGGVLTEASADADMLIVGHRGRARSAKPSAPIESNISWAVRNCSRASRRRRCRRSHSPCTR